VFRQPQDDGPEGVLGFLCALIDCLEDDRATGAVPGCRKLPDWSMEASTEPNIPAELRASDALLINGFIAHGRGFNRTQKPRRVIFCDFIPSFLIPDEVYLSLSQWRLLSH